MVIFYYCWRIPPGHWNAGEGSYYLGIAWMLKGIQRCVRSSPLMIRRKPLKTWNQRTITRSIWILVQFPQISIFVTHVTGRWRDKIIKLKSLVIRSWGSIMHHAIDCILQLPTSVAETKKNKVVIGAKFVIATLFGDSNISRCKSRLLMIMCYSNIQVQCECCSWSCLVLQ